MQFLVGAAVLITLSVAVYGEYIKCGNRYCHDGFYCYNGACYPRRPCTHHVHCLKDQFCDTYLQVCRKGVRRCSHQQQCGAANVCKGGVCSKRECRMHKDCPGNDSCESGICTKYESYCYEGYNNYCKYGYACLNKKCTKKECSNNYDCEIGNHCAKGFCKPIKDFCRSDGDCAEDQCCANTGNGDRGGVCRALRKPGSWCPLQQNLEACPCVTGYVCNIKTNIYWGQCEAVDGGSGSGSGSEDF